MNKKKLYKNRTNRKLYKKKQEKLTKYGNNKRKNYKPTVHY